MNGPNLGFKPLNKIMACFGLWSFSTNDGLQISEYTVKQKNFSDIKPSLIASDVDFNILCELWIFIIIPVSDVIELLRSIKLSWTRITRTFHAREKFWLFSYYSNYISVFGLVARYLAIFSSAATLAFSARREG